jgi:DNA primase large subunit
MSKRDLKKYLAELNKGQLEEQLLELYDKFGDVKTYYDFVFNPKEEKLVGEAKAKISNEYFPVKTKRAKLRRSTAQKYIKHFLLLGVDPFAVADVMLYSIEVAQKYSARREMRYVSFYKSMQNSFEQAVNYVIINGIVNENRSRIVAIFEEAVRQKWENRYEFTRAMEQIEG